MVEFSVIFDNDFFFISKNIDKINNRVFIFFLFLNKVVSIVVDFIVFFIEGSYEENDFMLFEEDNVKFRGFLFLLIFVIFIFNFLFENFEIFGLMIDNFLFEFLIIRLEELEIVIEYVDVINRGDISER